MLYQRVASDLRATIDAFDPCGKPFTLGNDAGPLLNIGNNELTWTVRDSGPLPGGGHNSDFVVQQVAIEDTQAPIMVPPPSRVIEVPAADSGLDADEVHLGAARGCRPGRSGPGDQQRWTELLSDRQPLSHHLDGHRRLRQQQFR